MSLPLHFFTLTSVTRKKIAKCLEKLPKNDFTRKMIDFDTLSKIAQECGRFGQTNCCQGFKKLHKVE